MSITHDHTDTDTPTFISFFSSLSLSSLYLVCLCSFFITFWQRGKHTFCFKETNIFHIKDLNLERISTYVKTINLYTEVTDQSVLTKQCVKCGSVKSDFIYVHCLTLTILQFETVKCNNNYVGVKCKCHSIRNGLCKDSCVVFFLRFSCRSDQISTFFFFPPLEEKKNNTWANTGQHVNLYTQCTTSFLLSTSYH